ncbi:ATP-binding protein [Streptomyces sp. NPDC053474]|uniref:ATP-binding protein n=1 Tax=Streptomyces sp. NPDC053474 TaxID=3365704 RepID=UPI0037D2B140
MSFYEESTGRLRCVLPFEVVPSELRFLRRSVRRTMEQWGAAAVSGAAELAATELAANVIKHVGDGTAATLVLEPRDDRLRLELHDKSHAVPAARPAARDALSGRGLQLLAAVSLSWGTLLTATGKAVWCEISLEPARHCARAQRAAAVLDEYRRVSGVSSVTVPTHAALKESARDVIADLLHWLAAWGGDPDAALEQALIRYEAETGAASEAEAA